MADDIDPNAIPFVPDTTVSLIDIASGKPKTAFHDWMQALYDWMKRSVVDLTTKVTTLIDETDGLSASLVAEQTARIDGDTALAADITAVDVKADGATASGAVYLAAKAAPSGATAAYGWFLTAGSAYAGMEALALSGGGSAIGFTANQFRFVDSGTGVSVWNYSGGKFVFTGDVSINGSLVINGTVSEDQLALYSATRRSSAFWAGTYESEGWYTHYFTATAGSTVLIMAAASSGAPTPSAAVRALGFTDEIVVPLNESSLIVRAYVISSTGTHSAEIISRGTTSVGTADLFLNVIVIQR
jgi:hypothetical protein